MTSSLTRSLGLTLFFWAGSVVGLLGKSRLAIVPWLLREANEAVRGECCAAYARPKYRASLGLPATALARLARPSGDASGG